MRIAILDDEPAELELLSSVLCSHIMPDGTLPICWSFSNGRDLLRALKSETFDLVILDWQLADIRGVQVLQWIKEFLKPAVPVIMLSSRKTEDDVVQALNAGASEYIIKPFRRAELLARLNNVLRQHLPDSGGGRLSFGSIRFDVQQGQVSINGAVACLTLREFNLALLMFNNQGRPLSRSYLYEHLWARSEKFSSRTLDTHIYRIRNKLQLTSAFGWVLSTVYGYGYRLAALESGVRPEFSC